MRAIDRIPCLPRAAVLWLALGTLCTVARARAEPEPIDVRPELNGVGLGEHLELLRDRSRKLTFADVSGPAYAQRFVPVREEAPNFGFSSATYWVRFTVRNDADTPRAWLLELAFPLIDDVMLYIPRHRGGHSVRRSGDMHRFDTRDIAYRNVVFSLEERPHHARTYYMRVSSTSALYLPLRAWSFKAFLEHKHFDWAILCVFYGVLLAMACYTVLVFAFTKQREYLACAGYILGTAVFQFTAAGHTFQFILPRDVWWTHQLGAASVCFALACASWGMRACFTEGHPVVRPIGWSTRVFLALTAVSFFVPYGVLVQFLTVMTAALLVSVGAGAAWLAVRDSREARLFLLGWGAAILGGLVAALFLLGVLPKHFLTTWSLQVGVSLQLVMWSSALADKLNVARAELSVVNGALSDKVDALSIALVRAREATERAERATCLKDEFMATMSHELRTPLNPIINIPQGLHGEFTRFEGEGNEVVLYTGEPARTRRLLTNVERSGRELLAVINGVLDFSKIQAGHLKLERQLANAGSLLGSVCRELRERAGARDITLRYELHPIDLKLEVDTHRLKQALAQLIDNAIKFSPARAAVLVSAGVHDGHVAIQVRDTGIGIAPEHFASIFESFEQLDKGATRRYGGVGLGLAIARALVRMHGGEIAVESVLGVGSTFTIVLPRDAVAARAS